MSRGFYNDAHHVIDNHRMKVCGSRRQHRSRLYHLPATPSADGLARLDKKASSMDMQHENDMDKREPVAWYEE